MNLFQKISLARQVNSLFDQIQKGQPMTKWLPTLVTVVLGLISAMNVPIQNYITAHPASTVVFAAIYAIVKGLVASPLGQKVANTGTLKLGGFVIACLVITGFSQPSFAQDSPTNVYAVGASYSVGGTPAVAGTGLYAHKVGDSGTYAFTMVDALPSTLKPFTVTTNFSAGIAQKIFTIGKVPIFIPTSAGVSWNGSNTGWAWSTGAMASIKVKGNWRVLPNVRIVKSSVSGGTGYQPVVGILFGWGQ